LFQLFFNVEAINIDLTEEQIRVLLGVLANNLGESVPLSDILETNKIFANFSFLQHILESSKEQKANATQFSRSNLTLSSTNVATSTSEINPTLILQTILHLDSQPPPPTREHTMHLEVRLAQPVAITFFTGTGTTAQRYKPHSLISKAKKHL
jgi:lipopolysaccharide export LptBFGC system permease protein LptF